MHKFSFSNVFKSLKSANQNKQEAEFDLSSIEFPIIDVSTRPMSRRRIARTGDDSGRVITSPQKDYSKNDYRVVREETRNLNNEVIDTYYFVYRVYSSGGQRRVLNEDEIDWAVSRTFNQ